MVRITKKYGGLLWGEHGKGVRSEFSPRFFGPLYPRIAVDQGGFRSTQPAQSRQDRRPRRRGAAADRRAHHARPARPHDPGLRCGPAYDEALHCNGNGACFTWDPDEAMCPSYKATRDRRHSPKGRASLIREWLRQLAALGFDPAAEAVSCASARLADVCRAAAQHASAERGEPDFSHAVKDAMDGCLACKSCTGQCPIKVDVPTFRAKFLELYYSRYLRPRRDYLVGSLETMLPAMARRGAPTICGWTARWAAPRCARFGLVHTPKFSRLSMRRELAARGIADATPQALSALSAEERARSVVLVQDAFTSWYETHVVLAVLDLMRAIGFRPFVAPFRPNGKPLHVHGFLGAFTARR